MDVGVPPQLGQLVGERLGIEERLDDAVLDRR